MMTGGALRGEHFMLRSRPSATTGRTNGGPAAGALRTRVAAVRRVLRELPDSGGARHDVLAAALGEAFGWHTPHVHRSVPANGGYAFEFTEGFTPAQVAIASECFASTRRVLMYDPMRPALAQRNRVVCVGEEVGYTAAGVEMFRRLGLDVDSFDQTRMLVCDGELLLAWVGGHRSTPLDARERRAFASLAPFLRRLLAIDRKLRDAAVAAAGLGAALDRIASPVFVAGPGGFVEHANAVGRAALERAGSVTRTAMTEAVAAFERGTAGSAAQVTQLTGAGLPPRWLVVLPALDGEAALTARADAAARAWKLTARQAEVLGWLVRGDANKTIAHRLGCSPSTIEIHVTAIFRKARVDGRTALVSRVLASL
jgi:DNA-binding CsgD family transcriptional regulator